MGKTKKGDEVDLTTPQKNLKFNFQNDVYKSQTELERKWTIAKVKNKEKINITNNRIRNIGILATKTNRRIGQKKTEMAYQLIDTFHIKALQNIDECDKLNSINVRYQF